ncbi:BRISC and BRCA1-A complex member 1-like Protein [Tribolium castaneum]|uniref:BRISC and BRCA1-A complex member 1-like Protein n=1 Tax=Tribolium castaneum TaxID=7070 RepID=D6WBJ6_TRICA|nr:PREDICTED: BRISC and BRCA1-A complex member 1 [Tribolium castaneum]EEZ98909.1 BRISC and BRCA1-A complex member 1-like Protein [Tribolium castaneum]|eukprot:XP_008200625.1 PREDICTED: BRISC and BRCA1-A complex member 1 [Tribolium castaneum]
MSNPSTSRERIIPITMEVDTSPPRVLSPSSPKRTLPMANCPEKIILVVDSVEDDNFTPFRVSNSETVTPFNMLKRAVDMFLHRKSLFSKKHEYALAILNENSVVWLVDFTNNINQITKALQRVEECKTEDIFDLNSLFDVVLQKVEIPEVTTVDETIIPPPYSVRVVLFYGRSYTIPKIVNSPEIEAFLEKAYFTLDVLITHEVVDDNNNCNKIFAILQNLDRKGFAYFFSVGRDKDVLFVSLAKLLGHPLQRPIQKLAKFSLVKDD